MNGEYRSLTGCAWVLVLLLAGCGSGGSGGGGEEFTADQCQDGLDNDGDGLIDCADPDCQGYVFCVDGGGDSDVDSDADSDSDADTDTGSANDCPEDPTPPGADPCPDECTGGCDAGVCTIDCVGVKQCEDLGTITCPADFACTIVCEQLDACDSLTINCPELYACLLQCDGDKDACGDVNFQCGAASCTFDCGSPASVCEGAVMTCGAGECTAICDEAIPPGVNCGESCYCTEC